MRDLYHILEDE